jgi:hypothetical protein
VIWLGQLLTNLAVALLVLMMLAYRQSASSSLISFTYRIHMCCDSIDVFVGMLFPTAVKPSYPSQLCVL